ncbi:substrate-binding domain-containing protein [Methylobacterium sp. NEAU 140]|uniref:substrate-binding domain-containing protein n=1 Tax=Methylobacterium sp. NEAU 140 TaxID=3064945 RepID=UPI0027332792|nr:substrate-binding domain-containing protein [Methylobacterium sp. NEAU 140]MDP4022858.1 substrate-binding domain-containing protein [Methylobacterium sp. NEAU 140]
MHVIRRRAAILGGLALSTFALSTFALSVLAAVSAGAAELRVVSSGGFAAAYRALAPRFEGRTGLTLVSSWGPSMGSTANAVPQRLARHEPIDVVIMVGSALDDLVRQGQVVPDSRQDLARSLIGAAVRRGAPRPDIGTADGLRSALLAAKSVVYSDSASGVYIQSELFARLGIADRMAGKARMIPAEPVGEVVARGEADLGFQQISELKPVPGIDLLGPIPDAVQQATVFSAGIVASSPNRSAARALIDYLASEDAATAVRESGLEPLGR